jgi:hypothetical protein
MLDPQLRGVDGRWSTCSPLASTEKFDGTYRGASPLYGAAVLLRRKETQIQQRKYCSPHRIYLLEQCRDNC